MFLAAAALIILGVALFVAAPLGSGLIAPRGRSALEVELMKLEHERGLAVQGLRELEFDREMGKLSAADFEPLRAALENRALAAMAAIEKLRKRMSRPPILLVTPIEPAPAPPREAAVAIASAAAGSGPAPEPQPVHREVPAAGPGTAPLRVVTPRNPEPAAISPVTTPLPASAGRPDSPRSPARPFRFCPRCGARIGAGANFCAECGVSIKPAARVAIGTD